VQELSAVRDWNCWLSACASLPFCTLKPAADPDPAADDVAADEGVGVGELLTRDAGVADDAEEGAGEGFDELLPAALPEGTPGDET